MTKAEYMEKLKEKLGQFHQGLQNEILEDYEQHFSEGLAMGRTEEEIIRELGRIEDMIQEIPEEDYKQEVILPKEEKLSGEKQAYDGSCTAIELDGMAADIILKESEDSRIYVDYQNPDGNNSCYRFYQKEEDGVFYAGVRLIPNAREPIGKQMKFFGRTIFSFSNIGFASAAIKLTVFVPRDFPRINVHTLSGDAEAFGIHVRELVVGTVSGDVELSDIAAERLNVGTASGDVKMRGVGAVQCVLKTASGDLDVKSAEGMEWSTGSGSGDIVVRADVEKHIVKTGSGDVRLVASQRTQGIEVTTGSGDADVDLMEVKGAEIRASVGSGDINIGGSGVKRQMGKTSFHTYGNGFCKVSVATGSGDLTVRCR